MSGRMKILHGIPAGTTLELSGAEMTIGKTLISIIALETAVFFLTVT